MLGRTRYEIFHRLTGKAKFKKAECLILAAGEYRLLVGNGNCWPTVADHDPCINDVFCVRERPFCPMAALRNRPLPGPGDPASDAKRLHLLPGVVRSRTFPVQASRTPGVTRPTSRADCIEHSMDDSDAQVHNAMFHIILAS